MAIRSRKFLYLALLPAILFLSVFTVTGFSFGKTEDEINKEVQNINDEIQLKKNRLNRIDEKKKEYSDMIAKKQAEQESLQNQLEIIDGRIEKSLLDIERSEIEIDKISLEIRKVLTEIDSTSRKINEKVALISKIVNTLYKQGQSSSLEIILLNDSLSDFINQSKYLEDINVEVKNSLDDLKSQKRKLERDQVELKNKNDELLSKKKELEDKKIALESEKEDKIYLLDSTKESEIRYQSLLEEARSEQKKAAADIVGLEQQARKKIAELEESKRLMADPGGFSWPVPKNVITAYFHDPEYPFRNVFEHPAIDVRAGQGTPIKAAASGYVARAKDAGSGYSYIMLVHADGLSTVYGHVSKIYVKEDEYIVQGQTIGLSGGMPGTPGAGRMTTGPHLHFEVRSDGIPVNPLDYLK